MAQRRRRSRQRVVVGVKNLEVDFVGMRRAVVLVPGDSIVRKQAAAAPESLRKVVIGACGVDAAADLRGRQDLEIAGAVGPYDEPPDNVSTGAIRVGLAFVDVNPFRSR